MSKLLFEQNNTALFEFPLRKIRNWIGRSDLCELSLTGSEISRRHCLIERRNSRWVLSDRSKHGTRLNGMAIKKVDLSHGDRMQIGTYSVRFVDSCREDEPTIDVVPLQPQVQVLGADEHAMSILTSELVLDDGRRFLLNQPEMTVGGGGSHIILDAVGALPDHALIKTERGRVMIAPLSGPVLVDGQKLSALTPIYDGERFQIGTINCQIRSRVIDSSEPLSSFGQLVGHSHAMKRVFGILKRFAGHDFHVLITGESGTGKELAAKAIHSASSRATGPFVPINCAAMPSNLIESELFGHVKGAFTGAIESRKGAFERAASGTLFLDELGEMPLAVQSKLLRVLESGEVCPIGGGDLRFPDVRILAATNSDISQLVHDGRLRADLLYRLQVLSVHMPPLRNRKEDIGILSKKLLRQLAPAASLDHTALAALKEHDWPGNIRELRNVLTRAFVMSGPNIRKEGIIIQGQQAVALPSRGVANFEASYLKSLLFRYGGNRSAVARELGLARTTLLYRLKKHGLA